MIAAYGSDDVAFTADARDNSLGSTLLNIQTTANMREKQYIVLHSLWQYPGLLARTKSYVCIAIYFYFLTSNLYQGALVTRLAVMRASSQDGESPRGLQQWQHSPGNEPG